MDYWLRRLSLSLCRALGGVLETLRRPVPRLILSLVGTAIAIVAAGWVAGIDWSVVAAVSGSVGSRVAALGAGRASATRWLSGWNVLSIWAFAVLAWSVWRARRQLVIARFEDFSDKSAGLSSAGFGALVATQLAALNDLFRGFDEGRPFQATTGAFVPLNATFQADGATATLDTTISSESSFALGPIKLPVGFMVGLIGRLVKGPTLSGHIHRDGASRIITVRLTGNLGNRTWLISEAVQRDASGAEQWMPAAFVANSVAHRVFTELSIGPTVRWEALMKFGDGVRAYRRSLKVARERALNLREAERCLIGAQAEDENFDLAYYNLGIVYTELAGLNREKATADPTAYAGMLDAAASAFERARQKDPNRWCTQFALATTSLQQATQAFEGDRRQAALLYLATTLDYYTEALRCAPDNAARAQTISVATLVHWWRGWRANPDGPDLSELQQAGAVARRGARIAWRALCKAHLSASPQREELGSPRTRTAAIASRSLRELAETLPHSVGLIDNGEPGAPHSLRMRWRRRALASKTTKCLKLARSLSPGDSDICMGLGTALRQRAKWPAAARAFRSAAQLNPENPEAWAALALALAHLDDRQGCRAAATRLFGLGHVASPDSIALLLEANAAELRLFDAIAQLRAARAEAGLIGRARLLIRFTHLGWRLAERRIGAYGPASIKLANLTKNAEALELYREGVNKITQRAKGLLSIRQEVPQLVGKGTEGIDKLATLLQELRATDRAWEFGDVGFELGSAYYRAGELDKAYDVFREMIQVLGSSLDGEIKRRGLHAQLSRILRERGKPAEALVEARRAIDRDPLSDFERLELGQAYLDLAEYAAAQDAFEYALQFAPNSPMLHMFSARAHLLQLEQCPTKAARAVRLDSARREITAALDLFDENDSDRHSARYDLASVQQYMGNWLEALRELRALERVGYCPLMVRLEIADVQLSTQDWVEAEQTFREVATELDALVAANGVNHVPDRPWDSDEVAGTAATWAHLGIANAFASRDVEFSQALAEVAKARTSLDGVSNTGLRTRWTGACDYTEGEILLKRDEVETAIVKLELALAQWVRAANYLKLAEALARRIELAGNGPQQAPTLRRAAGYLMESERLDFTNACAIDLARMQSRIHALSS